MLAASAAASVTAAQPAAAQTQPAAAESRPARLDDVSAKFLAIHCIRCHGAKLADGKLRLDTLPLALDDPENFARWRTIVDRIRSCEMPPEGEPRPDPA